MQDVLLLMPCTPARHMRCRLKALFMSEPGLNDTEGANSALSTALCLWRQCPDAWLSWGQLCDKRYEENPNVSRPRV